MTISLTIQGDDAPSIIKSLEGLLAGRTLANVDRPAPVAAVVAPQAAPGEMQEVPKPTRKKAADKPAQTIEGTATVTSEVDAITIDQAREHMKAVAGGANGMDYVSAALEHFGAKKVSDVDPDAGAKPSAKFAAFVAKIDEFAAAVA